MNRTRQATKQRNVKSSVSASAVRERRNSASMMIRKNKREESMMKRRAGAAASRLSTSTTAASTHTQQASEAAAAGALAALASNEQTQALLRDFHSATPAAVIGACTKIRKMLSIEEDPPIDRVLGLGVLPKLIQYVQCADQPKLALEAAWAITNIASGSSAHTRAVVDAGAIPVLVALLANPSEELRDQCVWALGNIAGDGAKLRDLCLQQNMMDALLYQFQLQPSKLLTRNTTWAISNLCRAKPAPAFASVEKCLPALAHLLNTGDQETVIDAAWALSYLTDGADEKIEAVVKAGVCSKLVQLLSSDQKSVQTPALRAVGNIVTGTESQTQAIVALNPFAAFSKLLMSSKRATVKETCWAISNITAGTPPQIQSAIDSGLLEVMADKMLNAEFEVKKEACWAISNATTGGSLNQTRQFVERKTVRALVEMLAGNDTKIILVALEALENILKAGTEAPNAGFSKFGTVRSIYADWFEEANGIDALDVLQDHQNERIYDTAVRITEKYFDGEEVVDDATENLAPNIIVTQNPAAKGGSMTVAVPMQSTFQFGMQTTNTTNFAW